MDGQQLSYLCVIKTGYESLTFPGEVEIDPVEIHASALKEYNLKEAESLVKNAKILIQPITDVHLYSASIDDRLDKGDIKFVWLFGAIAVFILVIACINFINLSTARSANRAKEVGLRKVVGSNRTALVKQFLTESLVFSVLSFVMGFVIAGLLLPYFNTLTGKSLTTPWTAWWLLPVMIGAAIIIGVIAGLYPSFYLSSFKPISVLKGQLSRGSKNAFLRNGLVIFQFTTSIFLIIGTLVIYNQTQFLLNRKVGFDKDQVMLIQGTNTLGDKTQAFQN
jgi:putative ABC transport system permease protein